MVESPSGDFARPKWDRKQGHPETGGTAQRKQNNEGCRGNWRDSPEVWVAIWAQDFVEASLLNLKNSIAYMFTCSMLRLQVVLLCMALAAAMRTKLSLDAETMASSRDESVCKSDRIIQEDGHEMLPSCIPPWKVKPK